MAQPHLPTGQVTRIRPLGAALPEARTTALLKAEQLEVVRVVLAAGTTMREHSAPGEITLLGIEGEIELRLPTATHRLGAGDFILLAAGEPHALHALSDASVLVTICLVPRG